MLRSIFTSQEMGKTLPAEIFHRERHHSVQHFRKGIFPCNFKEVP